MGGLQGASDYRNTEVNRMLERQRYKMELEKQKRDQEKWGFEKEALESERAAMQSLWKSREGGGLPQLPGQMGSVGGIPMDVDPSTSAYINQLQTELQELDVLAASATTPEKMAAITAKQTAVRKALHELTQKGGMQRKWFQGAGIEAQQLNNYLNSLEPEQAEQEYLRLSKQGLAQPRTVSLPDGRAIVTPGYSFPSGNGSSSPGASQSGSGNVPPGSYIIDKPLGVNDSKSMVNDAGEHPDPGMTRQQAVDAGFKVQSAMAQNTGLASSGAYATLDQLDSLVNTLWPQPEEGQDPSGLTGRMKQDFSWGVSRLTQDNTDLSSYEAFRAGTIAPLIRAIGEKGNLATEDVGRALELLPSAGNRIANLPDSPEVAQAKMKQLRIWFDKAMRKVQEKDPLEIL